MIIIKEEFDVISKKKLQYSNKNPQCKMYTRKVAPKMKVFFEKILNFHFTKNNGTAMIFIQYFFALCPLPAVDTLLMSTNWRGKHIQA